MKKFQSVMAIMLVIAMLALVGCDFLATTDELAETSEQGETLNGTNEQGAKPSGTKEQVLIDNNMLKVTFIEVFEEPSISGVAYLRLKVENRTDKTVTVYPQDAYVNGTSIILGSGVPMKLAPGTNSQAPFIIFYTNLGITSKDEIKKIEFKLTFDDENYDTIVETDNLIIELNK